MSIPCTSSSTSCGWSPGHFSWPVPTCQSPILHVALGRDVPFPFPSWAAHLYPLVTRGQSPPRPAWLSTPSPTDLRAAIAPTNTHHRAWPLVYAWLDLLRSPADAQPSEIYLIWSPRRGAFRETCTPCPSWSSSVSAGRWDVPPLPWGSGWKRAVLPAMQIAVS